MLEHDNAPVVMLLVPFFMSPVAVNEEHVKIPVVNGFVPLLIPEVTIELVQVNDEQVNAPVVIA